MICPDCGSNIKDDARFCPKCGCKVSLAHNAGRVANDDMTVMPVHTPEPAHTSAFDRTVTPSPAPTVTGVSPAGGLKVRKKPFLSQNQYKIVLVFSLAVIMVVLAGTLLILVRTIGKRTSSGDEYVPVRKDVSYTSDSAEAEIAEQGTTEIADENSAEDVSALASSDTYEKEVEQEWPETQNDAETDRDYILPYSDRRYLSESDLYGLSKEECRLARNELYARHGRLFDDEELQAYFNRKDWYYGRISPADFQESVLNDYEFYNRDLIVTYEKEKGYR